MKKLTGSLFAFMLAALLLCTQTLCVYAEAEAGDTSVRISLLGKYDSADTASIKQINSLSKTIQFRNHDTGKNYTLKYDNTSQIMDIHGDPISATLLDVGEVVDITFLKGTKHLNSLIVSKEAWVEEGVTDFSLVSTDETAKINGSVLHLTHKTMIISDGQAVNPEDILDTDTLRVSGIDKEIYSIVVTRGHGYVSLSSDKVNERSLVGAWIELDKEVIRRITPRMLISAPEGSYNVSIAGNGTKFSSEIVVNRNEETIIDTSVVEVEKVKKGNVTFIVTPSEARVFVDDNEVHTEVPNSFIYGKHKVHVMAEGYESQDHYLKVAEPDAKIFIELDKKEDEEDKSEEASTEEDSSESIDTTPSYDYSSSSASYRSSVDDNSTSQRSNSAATATSKRATITPGASSSASTSAAVDSSAAATTASTASGESTTSDSSSTADTGTSDSTGATTTAADSSDTTSTSPADSSDTGNSTDDNTDKDMIPGCTVTFDAPVGAEAYLDGNYLGIMPVSFAKSAGQHMVTLKKDGYETRSYTIQIDREKTNVSYTFPDLVKEKSADDDSGSSSTSDDSNNSSADNTGDEQQGSGNSDNGDSNNSGEGNTGSSDSGNTDASDRGNTGAQDDENPDNPGEGDTGSSDSGNSDTSETGSPDSGNSDTSETSNPDNPQQGEDQGGTDTDDKVNPETGNQGTEEQNNQENPGEAGSEEGISDGSDTGPDKTDTTDTSIDGGDTDNGSN